MVLANAANEDYVVTTDGRSCLFIFVLTDAEGLQEPGQIFSAERKNNLLRLAEICHRVVWLF